MLINDFEVLRRCIISSSDYFSCLFIIFKYKIYIA